MNFADAMMASIERAGVKVASSVPDSWVESVLEHMNSSEIITHVPAAREEDAMGICCGAALSGVRSLCLMQNAGALNCGGTLSTFALSYGIPFVMIIADRGHLGDSPIGHVGKAQVIRPFLDALRIPYYDLSPDFHERNQLVQAFELAEAGQKPIALMITRATLGRP